MYTIKINIFTYLSNSTISFFFTLLHVYFNRIKKFFYPHQKLSARLVFSCFKQHNFNFSYFPPNCSSIDFQYFSFALYFSISVLTYSSFPSLFKFTIIFAHYFLLKLRLFHLGSLSSFLKYILWKYIL